MFDFILIGTGAGGGTLARKLAPSGKKILILERGDFLPVEKENWNTKKVLQDNIYGANEAWFGEDGEALQTLTNYCVGGSTKFYGAAMLRLKERDFEKITHNGGISPAWPVSYETLAPHYTEAEAWYHVHGERGSDPLEVPENSPYPHPPLKHEKAIAKLFQDFKNEGLRPFPLPIAVDLEKETADVNPFTRFDGYPDPTKSKGDAETCGVVPALEYENVTLLTNRFVEKLITDESGKKITGVRVDFNGEKETYEGKTIIVACGAVNSAALFLRSANEKHPNGLANSSDQVGRNYMCHNNSALRAFSTRPNDAIFGKTLGISDFYFENEFTDYPLGLIQMMGKSDATQVADDLPDVLPDDSMPYIAGHSFDFWLTTEDTPSPDNRVTLTPDGKIKLRYEPTNTEAHEGLKKALKTYLDRIDFLPDWLPNNAYFGSKMPVEMTAHQCGTLRFGTDPKTSVVDENLKVHEIDNLYVVDGSVFPSSTSTNPGLTIMALAIRAGEYLLKKN